MSVPATSFTRTRMNESGRAWDEDRSGPASADGLLPGHPATRARFLARMDSAADPGSVADIALAAMDGRRSWAIPDRSFELDTPEALRR